MKNIILITIFVIFISACTNSVRFTSVEQKFKNVPKKDEQNKSNKRLISRTKVDNEKVSIFHNEFSIDNQHLSNQLIEHSKNWLGVPYQYGGNSTNGIDCSGFVQKVYYYAGYELPRTAAQQFDFTKKIPRNSIKEGDLVFFKRRNKIFHVGIYIGDNKLIHASTTKGVIIQDLSDNWLQSNLFAFGRVN